MRCLRTGQFTALSAVGIAIVTVAVLAGTLPVSQVNASIHLITGCVPVENLEILTVDKLHDAVGIIPAGGCIGIINRPACIAGNDGFDITCVLQLIFIFQLVQIGTGNGVNDGAVGSDGHCTFGIGHTLRCLGRMDESIQITF